MMADSEPRIARPKHSRKRISKAAIMNAMNEPTTPLASGSSPAAPAAFSPGMKFKMLLITSIVLLVALAAFWLVSTSRVATETPDYKVVRTDGKFEIRDYPALTVATTAMEGEEVNRGFGKLFRFITGSNQDSEKIAMTSPVLIDTAEKKKTMSFIMPGKAVEKGVPKPSEETVTLGKVQAARLAVLRFDGGRTAENEKAAIEKLKAWLDAEKLAGKGAPIFAYYDPPWTPTFTRRNEVMIRVDKHHE